MDVAQPLALELHPLLREAISHLLTQPRAEHAVFAAHREVEIRVRKLAQAPQTVVGAALMEYAFNPSGPLADTKVVPAEQVATMALFRGAIGLFKNPSSHRRVPFEDTTFAQEAIGLADLLMRLLDQVEMRLLGGP